MEASGAGLAGGQGQGGDGAAQGAEGAAEGQPQGLDQAAFQQTLESMQGGQEQLRQQLGQLGEYLQSQPWQQPEAEAEPESLDLSFLGDPMMEPQQQAQRLTDLINQQADQRAQDLIQQHLSPLQKDLQELRLERGAESLVAEFPELGDPEVANEVVSNARQYAELLGQPELGNSPLLWRLVYAAGRAYDADAGEKGSGAETPGAAHLEGGAGAAPGGSQVDLGDLIVNGGGASAPLGKRVLPFG